LRIRAEPAPTPRERRDESEPEPGARRVRATASACKPLEDTLLLAPPQAGTLVEDGEVDLASLVAAFDRDGAARRVVERVFDQVVEDDREVLVRRCRHRFVAAVRDQAVPPSRRSVVPALLCLLDGRAQRDGAARRRPIAFPGEREQRGEQPREPLDLALGGVELGRQLGPRLERRRLEP